MNIQLFNDDCRVVMAGIESGSIDLIVTDPPYYSTNLAFDKAPRIDFKAWLFECQRVLKPTGVLVSFADFNLLAELRGHKVFKSTYELIWQKTIAVGMLNANKRPLRSHEYIGIFTDAFTLSTYNPQKTESTKKHHGKTKRSGQNNIYRKDKGNTWRDDSTRHPTSVLSGFYDKDMFNTSADKSHRHPTQKPLDMVSWLIKTYSNEGDLILDPFMGSGTTGHAASLLNRRFIGCELGTTYFAIAKARIEDAQHDLVNYFGEVA
jgi:site-specific DNA-methyltransferase (adenine-specific)